MELNDQAIFSFGEFLQRVRKRKRLSQKQLGEKIGASRETVSLWERELYKPETDAILYELARVLGLTEQERQQLFEAYTITALKTSFHNPPFKRNPYFTGREAQIRDLHTLLLAGKQVALTQAISGLGGVGKTQLALEYAYQHHKSYHDIFWVYADTEEALIASFVQLAKVLHLPEYEEFNQNKAVKAVYQWLKIHTGWLLILDNVEELTFLHRYVPLDRQGAVLLTTRRQVTEPVAQALELVVLPEDEAILFLLKRAKRLAIDQSLKDASEHDSEGCRAVARLLGHLPLALDQAGAYMLETQCSFKEYCTLFQAYRDRMLSRRIGEGLLTDHAQSVSVTFRLNIRQIHQRSLAAEALLYACAFLAPDAIGEELFTQGVHHLGPSLEPLATDDLLFHHVIEILRTFSLIQRDSEKKILGIHRLVQAVIQDTLNETERHTWAERTLLAVNAAFPRAEYDTWSQCERVLPHALQVVRSIDSFHLRNEEARQLLYKTAFYLHTRAHYAEAEPLYQHALQLKEQLPDVDSATADMIYSLATLYAQQGKFAQAEPLFHQALQEMGSDHPERSRPLHDLALLYAQQGKFVQAEPLFLQVLAIKEQQLGSTHLEITYPLNNLADLYREQGQYVQSEQYYRRALQIREKHLAPDHPAIATTLHGLATLSQYQGKYTEAEPLYRRALSIREQQMDPNDPVIATTSHGLADLYREQGKYAEAEPLYRRALQIREHHLDATHPTIAITLLGLAELYREQARYSEAEPLYRRTIQIREVRMGLEHPALMYPLTGLANLFYEQDNAAEAEPLYLRALDIGEQRTSTLSLERAYPLVGRADLLRKQRKDEQAESLYLAALHIWEQADPTHPDRAYPLSALASLYGRGGKYAQAEALLQQALRLCEHTVGVEHPKTAEVMAGLAQLRELQTNWEEARKWYTQVLAIRHQALGAHHPKTEETQKRLEALSHTTGTHEEPLSLKKD